MGLIWACFRVWYPNRLVFVFFLSSIVVSVWVQIFGSVGTLLPTSRKNPRPPSLPPQPPPPPPLPLPERTHAPHHPGKSMILVSSSWLFGVLPCSVSVFGVRHLTWHRVVQWKRPRVQCDRCIISGGSRMFMYLPCWDSIEPGSLSRWKRTVTSSSHSVAAFWQVDATVVRKSN